MKKRTLAALLAACLALTLTACGGGGTTGGESSDRSDGAGSSSGQKEESSQSTPPEEPDASFAGASHEGTVTVAGVDFTEVSLGETVTVAGVDFTFETQGLAKEIRPAVQSGSYNFLGEREGMTLFYVKGTLTNNGDEDYAISWTWIDCKCSKNGGDPWISPHLYVETKSGLIDGATVAPGETYTFYLADSLETDWLENEYETYQFLFHLPENREATPENGYCMTFHK